ncbi:hypothetical protein [Streptomyces flavidovirens]|uniref:hypothetical protein n=1 Tax=Streptomyces flavidovirens TaxID=67298 RepID=UPI00367D9537
MSNSGLTPAQHTYAHSLRALFERIPLGLRAFARRPDVPYDASLVSRFLSGQRSAPAAFVDCLLKVAGELAKPPPSEADRLELTALRRTVMRESNSPSVRLVCVEEELHDARLKVAAAREHADVQQYLRSELLDDLTGLHLRLGQLRRDNEHQQLQLEAASTYVRDVENDLRQGEQERRQAEETIGRLEREIDALRREVYRLRQNNAPLPFRIEPTGLVTAALDVQLGWKAWRRNWMDILARGVMALGACAFLISFRMMVSRDDKPSWLFATFFGGMVVAAVGSLVLLGGERDEAQASHEAPRASLDPTAEDSGDSTAHESTHPVNQHGREQQGQGESDTTPHAGPEPPRMQFVGEMDELVRREVRGAAARLGLPTRGERRTVRWLGEALGEDAFRPVQERLKELDKQLFEFRMIQGSRRARRAFGDCDGCKAETRQYAQETFAQLHALVDRHLRVPAGDGEPVREGPTTYRP